jgi:hypothetical protein
VSYKVRNSIVLGVLMVLIIGVGTYVRAYHIPKKMTSIEAEIARIDVELSNTPNLIHEYNELSTTVANTKKRWESRSKEIPPEDITGTTYEYFSQLIERSGGLKLNMIYQGVQGKGNYGFNVYSLRGEGRYPNLYKFIWFLENGRKLFKVNTLSMKGLEVAANETREAELLVTFEMTVHAFFAAIPELAKPSTEQAQTPTYLWQDPFEPVIAAALPPNKENLVEIERSDVKAVIPGKAFVVDQTNNFRTLEVGDQVYLGYVTKLSPDEGKIECTLNKGGIIERVELKIRYGAALQRNAFGQQQVVLQK